MKASNNYIGSNICINTDFRIGDIVEHPIFGVGKVLASEGCCENNRVSILFNNGEKKKLIVRFANLKKLWTDTWMDFLDINLGDIVEHNIFGVGKVIMCFGAGDNKRVNVLFRNGKTKRLIVKHANLIKLF